MNYLQLEERKRLYRERTSIEEFENDGAASINTWFLETLFDSIIATADGAEEKMLAIFNNAYYITTTILMKKHPIRHFNEYINIARGGNDNPYQLCNVAITMGMVHVYLESCDKNYQMNTAPIKEKIKYFDYNSLGDLVHLPYSLGINSPRNIFAIFASLARNDNFHKLYTIDRDVFAPLTETTNQSTTLDAQVENLLGHEAEDELMNSEMTEDTIIELRQKVRIEVLNFLFAKIGYNTAWIKANRKQTAMSELFAAIMGLKNPKSIYEHIGRVQYAQKPQDLDVEIAEVNKLLQGINNEWRIAL